MKIIRLTILVLALLLSAVISVAQTPQSSPTPASPAGESTECTQAKATVTRLETRLRDWPALGRYRDDNGKADCSR